MALSFVLYGFLPAVKRRRNQVDISSAAVQQNDDQQQQLNIGLFYEQKAALDSQRDSGTLDNNEYEELLADAQRRLLQDVKLSENNSAASVKAVDVNSGRWLLISGAFVLLASSLFLYGYLGAATDMDIANLLKQSQGQQAAGQDVKSTIANQLQTALIKGTHKSPENLYYLYLIYISEPTRPN